jgi:CDP-6-deoxy-D-xylo-4-hexulose-3-dehydrase
VNVGAVPVFADVGEDYQMDIESVKENVSKKTKAILAVHILGNACNIKALRDIADDRGLFLIEDCCESIGSEYNGRKVGTFSDVSTFSFYFSHHITTGEGGMLCTSNPEYADLSKILRAHGYIRYSAKREQYTRENPRIDPRFLFVNLGYNIRPTDIQACIGLQQFRKLENFIDKRIRIARYLVKGLAKHEDYLILPKEKSGTRHTWFAFPVTIRKEAPFSKYAMMRHLENHGIETRPLICGNFAEQPAVKLFEYKRKSLKYAEFIMQNSFYFGIHPTISRETCDKVIEIFDSFLGKYK